MLSFVEARPTKPIHIHSTKKSLVVSVNLDKLPNVSYMLCCSEQDCGNFLKFWSAQTKRPNKVLSVFWTGTQALSSLKRQSFLRMQNVGTSLGWMVVRSPSRMRHWEVENTLQCRDTSKTEKPSLSKQQLIFRLKSS